MIQIEDCKRGDRKALEQLYRQYAGKLLSVCRHYIKDESAAEDVLHDAFIIIFTSIKDLKDTSKIEGWMITIARNLCFRYLRSIGKKEIPLEGITEHLYSDCTEEQKEGWIYRSCLMLSKNFRKKQGSIQIICIRRLFSYRNRADAPHSST